MRIPASLLAACLFAAAATAAEPPDEARLLRFPAIHGDQIVFTYAGDLYTVAAAGGTARRLTSHDGFEMFARFSPDGKQIAFTGQYDGNTEVYVMPAEGGPPRRLTFTATLPRDDVSDRMGPNNIVMGWTPDGKRIVFRSRMRSFNDFIGQLYTVSVDGGLPEELPLPRGGFCSYSPDGKKLAYNRVFREFRTWKRYRGGMADDVSIYDFETKKTEDFTAGSRDVSDPDEPADVHPQNIIPMWSGDKIYFLSDRDAHKRMNLYVKDVFAKTKTATRQLTQFDEFDVKFPSLGDKAIVFENGGWVYRLDLDTEKVQKVPIRILDDRPAARTELVNVGKYITDFGVSPDGKRALIGARGEVFTVPAQSGPTRNLTNTSGNHERNAVWSPDGKWVAYVSDDEEGFSDEIYIAHQDGKAETCKLTEHGDTYKYEIHWSPDSKKILWSDKKLRLEYLDVDTKAVTLVTQAKVWEIRDAVWSPDGKWVAYSQEEADGLSRVYLYSAEQNKNYAVTDPWYGSYDPAFSGDGKYLFFVSNRDFNPIYGETEFDFTYKDMARVYLTTLARDTPSPFKPKSDEVEAKKDEPKKDEPKKDEPKKDAGNKVDPEGLSERIEEIPITPSEYHDLASVGSTVYYLRHGSKDGKPALQMYDLAQRKETALGSVEGFEISADGKKMIVELDKKYGIIELPKGPVSVNEPLDLSGLEMKLDRHEEWQQIFNECWRQEADFFYDPHMHGVDWMGVRVKYAPLVKYVNHRADLTYIIGEMIGELNCGHCYVGGGDYPHPARVPTGLLGAELKADAATGAYRIVRILRGEPGDPKLRSPLTEMGVDAKEGEFIVAVDGRPTNEMNNIYEALLGKAGKQVTLRLAADAKGGAGRDVTVVPIANEAELYYYDWVEANIKKVSDATEGKVGYIHVPEMLTTGLNEFAKHYYPQLRKKALIIDVRGNGGGNVSPMLIERLGRQIDMITISRNSIPGTSPQAMVYGPKLCLMNEFSASDGDLFPYRFRAHHIGKLVGKRSWGGVVGIRESLPIVDGGDLRKPEFSRYDVEGKQWIIEGHGVDPDVVVDNDPAKEWAGEDEQLDKAISLIQEELKAHETEVPPPPPYPKK